MDILEERQIRREAISSLTYVSVRSYARSSISSSSSQGGARES